MSDESLLPQQLLQPQHEQHEQPLKASQYLRLGIAMGVKETHYSFYGCALGTAFRAKYGYSVHDHPDWLNMGIIKLLTQSLGIPYDLTYTISNMHADKVWSRAQCADILEKAGY